MISIEYNGEFFFAKKLSLNLKKWGINMSNFIYYQFYVFLATLYGGAIIALIYDFYKVFRTIMKPSKIATIIQDLVFWIIVTIIAISVLLYSDEGKLRGYTALGFLIGVCVYNMVLSDLVVMTLLKVFRSIGRAIGLFLQNAILPCKNYTTKVILKPYNKVKKIFALPHKLARDIRKYVRLIIIKKKKDI